MPIFLINRFWTICWLLLTTLWGMQHTNYLVLHRFRTIQQQDCWKPWTTLSRILLLFTIPWKRNLLILVISAYNFPNIAFNINRKVFTSDVFFIARNKGGNASVKITISENQSITPSETLAVIRVPQETFIDMPETVFSCQFRKPSLFFTESQLYNVWMETKSVLIKSLTVVLSASVLRRVIKDLTKNPIILSFKLLQTKNLEGISCQFWNPHLRKSKFGSIILFVSIRVG